MQKILLSTLLLLGANQAIASTSYGQLSNFDVVNDTGETCYGFEIEIDDVQSKDIGYTYDYNHYGTPKIREDNSVPAHPKVFIRYEGANPMGYYGPVTTGFTNPAAPGAIKPTDGHRCTNPSVNEGCEHFGVGVYKSFSAVKYHWLVKNAGGQVDLGPAVNVGAPVWTYQPPVFNVAPVIEPNPLPNLPPIVKVPGVVNVPAQVVAAIPAPVVPIPPAKEYGEPSWVKVIKTTTHSAKPVALEDLVGDDKDSDGHDDWTNGEPDEVESEWYLLQANNKGDGKKDKLEGDPDEMGDGSEIVTRRYEFYAYAAGNASIDGENGEAKCDEVGPDDVHGVGMVTVTDSFGKDTDFDCAAATVVGDYQGSQMGAFNAAVPLSLINAIQDGQLNKTFPDRAIVVGGDTPYDAKTTAGALPNGLALVKETGILYGVPSKVGVFNFTVEVTDQFGSVANKSFTMKVTGAGDVDGDFDVDKKDIDLIKAKLGQAVLADDPADLNGDRKVNVLDYRKAAAACTLPRCAVVNPPAIP